MIMRGEGGRPRVLGAHGFGLQVPDLTAAERYFTTLGMVVRDRAGELVLGCEGRDQDELIVSAGARKRIHHIAFSIHPDAIDAFERHLRDREVAFQKTAPAGGCREGLWFLDPWGTWINLVPRLPAPMRPVTEVLPANTDGERRRIGILAYDKLDRSGRPLRFQHVLLFTPQVDRAEDYYANILGLGVSDRKRGMVSFLYAGVGECWDHHCFAIVNNPARGLHHCSFEMSDIDQLGFCLQRMRDSGYKGGFGPGRQFLGSNLFAYIEDPWGSHTEISADMDQLDESCETRDWEEIPKLWGPEWKSDFWTANSEAV
ncbi:MAG: VOC family protein [Gammaproteobacteria bacterium]|nr:VOC family protein [Gammaproteobacteria bacterium]